MNKVSLSDIINKIIKESFGKIKKSAGRGYGTSQPYTIGADKPGLGYIENEIPDKEEFEKVKISKAFIKD
jgi:hypothetical protein